MGKEIEAMARPTNYLPEYAHRAYKLALLGCTDEQMAAAFDTSFQTLNTWKKKHPEFLESIKNGRIGADGDVARSLWQRATGYEHPDVHIGMWEGQAIITPIVKHYPPDVTAQIFWLKNRRPDLWRDVNKSEASVTVAGVPQKFIDLFRAEAKKL